MAWNYRAYGSIDDPIHKSHLNTITGDYGCLRKFRYQQDELAAGTADERTTVSAKAALGTAAHETIARALNKPEYVAEVLSEQPKLHRDPIESVLRDELEREAGQRQIDWGEDNPDKLIAERVQMVYGLLCNLHKHVAKVELVEAGFIVPLDGYWLSGHVDLIYRPRSNPAALGLADWKTSATRPDPIELDHSWEAGIYALAMRRGWFVRREELQLSQGPDGWTARHGTLSVTHSSHYRAERDGLERLLIEMVRDQTMADVSTRVFGLYPDEIRYVHLGDYVPYQKAGKKRIDRAEDLAHWQRAEPCEVSYVSGMYRGPAWLHVRQSEQDIPRLSYRIKNIVGTVRMGRFIDMVSERCKRCAYKRDCLNSGYGLTGADRRQLELSISGLPIENYDLKD